MTDTLACALLFYYAGQGHLHKSVKFKSLIVDGWDNDWWNSNYVKVLLVLSNHYKIERLDFLPKQSWLPWNSTLPQEVLPTAFCLKIIRIRYDGVKFPEHLKILFDRTKVHTIVCLLPKLTWVSRSERFISFFRHIDDHGWLDNNYSVKRIKFQNDDGTNCGHKWPDDEYDEMNRTLAILVRNQNSFRKCRRACVIFLSKKFKKEIRIDRDVRKLIAAMIWETVGTKVWSKAWSIGE